MNYSYIAGFFDSEGNINQFKSKGHTYYQLRMWQSRGRGLKLLKEIREFLGYGTLHVERYKNPKWRDVWCLNIGKKSDIKDFKEKVGKHCKIKEFPIDKTLEYLRSTKNYKLKRIKRTRDDEGRIISPFSKKKEDG